MCMAASSLRKSQLGPIPPCYIRCFVILTPSHPTPCLFLSDPAAPSCITHRSLTPPRQSLSSPLFLGPLPYRLYESWTMSSREHFHVAPNSLPINVHDLNAYTSQLRMHKPHYSLFAASEITIEVPTCKSTLYTPCISDSRPCQQ